jgi:hypothetical protein
MQCLLLNASYEPIRVISVERAVVLILTGKAEPVSDSGHVMRSPSTEVRVPLVARLVKMAKVPRMQRGTTIDHVVPRSQGGTTTWENCVMACSPCNFKKADKTMEQLGWTLKKTPEPVYGPMVLAARMGRYAELPEWAQWISPATA